MIVVTGGTDGLGKEIARELSPAHKIVILAPDKEKCARVAKELKCGWEVCDVSDPIEIEIAVQDILKKHNRIDVLVNNAVIWIEGKLEHNDPVHMRRVIEVNTLGTMFASRAVVRQMKKQKDGMIVNIISQAGLYGKAERSVYAASKFAITGFTKSLEEELKESGVRVTGIYPGFMKTNLFKNAGVSKDMKNAIDPREIAKAVAFVVASPALFPEIGIKYPRN